MVMDAGHARGHALAAIERSDAERTQRSIALDWTALTILPGTIVRVEGEAGRWRVAGSTFERMVVTLDLIPLTTSRAAAAASPGRALPAPDQPVGETRIELIELPPVEGGGDAPRLYLAAAGTGAGWRGASFETSVDDGQSWQAGGRAASTAVIGRIDVPPTAAPATIIDRKSAMEVTLVNAADLFDADEAAMDAGGNLAMVGDELVQFARAERLGGNRWRLSGLWRGRRGTEWATGTQQSGQRFVLIEMQNLIPVEVGALALGQRVRASAQGVGDAMPVETISPPVGWSVTPPAPVHLSIERDGGGGRVLRWTRRSRAGWWWRDLVDVPLGEESEHYRVRLSASDGTFREVDTPVSMLAIGPDDACVGAAVRQIGTTGASSPVETAIPGHG